MNAPQQFAPAATAGGQHNGPVSANGSQQSDFAAALSYLIDTDTASVATLTDAFNSLSVRTVAPLPRRYGGGTKADRYCATRADCS